MHTEEDIILKMAIAMFAAQQGQHADPYWPVGINERGRRREPGFKTVSIYIWEGYDKLARVAYATLKSEGLIK